ncbi:MAG TPA: cyclic nucleotide-binding domain-containing protein [Polyangiaceae bacterium]|nr:cyclic nucleotide-binding domain-containing protein [Polyangiaceae bacterium]
MIPNVQLSMTRASNPPTPFELTPAILRDIGLFGALPEDVLGRLAESLKVVHVAAGATLFREGEDGRAMYVVLRGEVEVSKRSHRGTEARVALLGPGDWFGEMSIVDVQPRSASILALAPTSLLAVTTNDLDQLYRHDLKAYAIIVLNLARELSRRLRVADAILADLIANVFDTMYYSRPNRTPPGE